MAAAKFEGGDACAEVNRGGRTAAHVAPAAKARRAEEPGWRRRRRTLRRSGTRRVGRGRRRGRGAGRRGGQDTARRASRPAAGGRATAGEAEHRPACGGRGAGLEQRAAQGRWGGEGRSRGQHRDNGVEQARRRRRSIEQGQRVEEDGEGRCLYGGSLWHRVIKSPGT